MNKVAECIPNFSIANDEKALNKLVETARSIAGVMLIDYSRDADHGRSVFTLAGEPEALGEAAFEMCKAAALLVDLNKHSGVHPRMGATDVIPFVPLKNMTMDECVKLSEDVGRRIGEELAIPVFLYEYSAKSPGRKNLADIRRGGFEAMFEKMKNSEWKADFGPSSPHPTAGVVAVGARKPLIAFNVFLDTDNLEIAKKIACEIRESSGGFPYCKAIGLKLEDRGICQVSMNMVNFAETPLHVIVEAIKEKAAELGVKTAGSELIGAIPAKALTDSAIYYLGIESFDYKKQLLENAIYGGLIEY